MAKIVVVGEGMIELSGGGSGSDDGGGGCGGGAAGWRLGFGGDTLNTAVHLARLGDAVAYLTALGTDPFSDELRRAWAAEGVDTALVLADPDRRPGLYAITNDPDGERHFTYWRGESAARRLFALPEIEAALEAAASADLLVFSMISLAILPAAGRAALFGLARRIRARGGSVAFDTNYRAALWPDLADARAAHAEALRVTDIGLPTIEDEAALTGSDDLGRILALWRSAGVGEVVVKRGADGCVVGDVVVPPPARLLPRDTSGAGDAFNAGYLHARLAGRPPQEAALAGHRLSGWVVMNRGAIPAIDADAPYTALAAG